ncbi:MAG: transketolase family protein [Actinobacteria bacterium]|nr:transketolase family protein [Actinomycetota bacterium]
MQYTGKINTDPTVMGSMRDAFCEALLEAGSTSPDVFVLTADQGKSVKPFAKAYPDRFADVGIAEANMVGIAAGLALSGKKPFITTIAAILMLRACEQIKDDVCYQNVPVKIVGHGGGLSYGVLGPTHHSVEDVGIARSIPNMTVVVPADAREAKKAVIAAIDYPSPIYIRIGTGNEQQIYADDYDFRIEEPVILRPSEQVCIMANSHVLTEAIKASQMLAEKGVQAGVVNVHTVKPMSKQSIIAAAGKARIIVTLEEHNILCGLGSAVAEVLSEEVGYRIIRLGVPDCFAPIGSREELYKEYKMDCQGIVQRISSILKGA